MKIFLLYPSVGSGNEKNKLFRQVGPVAGLATIAAVLKENRHVVVIEDQNATNISDRRLIEKISLAAPEIVGISCILSTHDKVINLCQQIKQLNPDIFIVLGNVQASYFADFFLKTEHVDAVVHGEGEYAFLEIVQAIEDKALHRMKAIKGISFIEKGIVVRTPIRMPVESLDKLPFPAWELLNLDYYQFYPFTFVLGKMIIVESGRGCRYHCDFCSQENSGTTVRLKSVKRIIDEIQYGYEKFNIKFFGFSDSHFPLTEQRGFEFCDAFEKTSLHKKLKWGMCSCVELLSERILKRMKEVGLHYIYYGFESGNNDILKKLGTCTPKIKHDLHSKMGWDGRCCVTQNRSLNNADYKRDCSGFGKIVLKKNCFKIMKISKKLGIRTIGMFLFGFPGETRESMLKTLDFAIKLDSDIARFGLIIPYPGSKLYEQFKENITFKKEMKGYSGQQAWFGGKENGKIFNYTKLKDKELQNMQNFAMRKYHFRLVKLIKIFTKINLFKVFFFMIKLCVLRLKEVALTTPNKGSLSKTKQ